MDDYLPGIFYRVVVRSTPGRDWKYLDPRSKTFTDVKHARTYQKSATDKGLTARLYFTSVAWQEAEVD